MNIIKKLLVVIVMSMTMFLYATDAFEFVNDGDYGYSYIQINQDLESFSFKSDWHSLGNAGRVGYVVYTADMSDSERTAYMEANANNPEFRKSINGGVLDFGSVKAGDRIGFYEVRPNGGTYTQTAFKEWHDKTWLAFDKNGGNGKDEWMSIENISFQSASGGSGSGGDDTGAPSGAPLPDALAVMIVGVVGAGAWKCSNKKKVA